MAFTRIVFFTLLIGITGAQEVLAEETDQFTLPPFELQDIGPAASRSVYEVLEQLVAQTNSEIQRLIPRAKHSRLMARKLAQRRNDAYLADLFYKKTGPGFPRWMRWMRASKGENPIQYKEKRPWKTVYWLVFSQSPLSLIGLAPTVNMFNYYFGTDKLGHFFMQGHTYYSIYRFYLNHGKSEKQAHEAIVTYGQLLEHSYLGTMVNGVYSNGDLAANYSGWKFYMNIAHSIQIGTTILPPILVLNGDHWQFSNHVNKETLLKPYLSDNLNEAFNPCRYSFTRSQIRRQIKKRCEDWSKREGITPQLITAKLEETKLWHGENYGHWLPKNQAVTLMACFGGQ